MRYIGVLSLRQRRSEGKAIEEGEGHTVAAVSDRRGPKTAADFGGQRPPLHSDRDSGRLRLG